MAEPTFLPGYRNTLPEEQPKPATPGFLDILPSAFQRENEIVSLGVAQDDAFELETVQTPGNEHDGSFLLNDPDFDPFETLVDTPYAQQAMQFVGADSPEEVELIKTQIDRAIERQEYIASANGFVGFMAELTAAVTSPSTFIPIGGTTYRGLRTGQSIARNAASVSVAATGGAALSETLLQATQDNRAMQESVINVLGAAAFGGVLGGGAGFFARGKSGQTVANEVYNDPLWDGIEVDADNLLQFGQSSIGAAKTPELPIELERMKSAFGAEKVMSFLGPQTRVLVQSGSKSAMKAMQGLAESAFVFKKNEEGIVTSAGGTVETAGKRVMGDVVGLEEQLAESFSQYRLGQAQSFRGDLSLAMQDMSGKTSDKLKRNEFSEQVFLALEDGAHEIPEVAAVADKMRAHIDALGKQGEELGMMPKGLVGVRQKNGKFYMPRIYKKDVIRRNRTNAQGTGFEDRLAQNYQAQAADVQQKIDGLNEERDILEAQAEEQKAKLPDDTEMAAIRRYGRKEPQKYPVLDLLRSMGGVKPGSVLAGELKAMGVTSRSHVGLFRTKGGIGDIDNIVQSEHDVFADLAIADDTGYMDPAVIYDLIGEELAGNPIVPRAADQDTADFYKMMFDRMREDGIDFSKSNRNVRNQLLSNRFRIERDADGNIIRDTGEGEFGGRQDLDPDYQASLDQQTGQFGADAGKRLNEIDEVLAELQKYADAADPAVARELATDTTNKILGMSDADLYRPPEPGRRGFLKERLIDIDPALIREYTQNNAVAINRRYSRVMATDIEMVKKYGDVEMTRVIEDIKMDYAQLRRDLIKDRVVALGRAAEGDKEAGPLAYLRDTPEGNKTFSDLLNGINQIDDIPDQKVLDILGSDADLTKAIGQLAEKEKATLRDIKVVRDRIRGQFAVPDDPHGIWNRTERGLLGLNYMRLLGGMVISAFPDLAMGIFRNGISRNVGVHMKLMQSAASYKASKHEMKLLGVGTEMAMDSRLAALTEYELGEGASTKFGRGVDTLQRNFGKVTLMTPWNAALKQMNGIVFGNFVVATSRKIVNGTATKKEITEMASWNIDAQLAKQIVEQIDRHSPDYDNTLMLGLGEWSNAQAAEEFRNALITQVDKTILTPGQEKPIWMSQPFGRLVGQFKSFSMAATQMILVSGMQRRSAEQLSGIMALIALGSVSYAVKEHQAGREIPPIDMANSGEWIKNSIDRSGVTGILFDANNIIEKITDGGVGISALTDTDVASRYKSRNKLGAVFGPSTGTVNDILGIVDDAKNGDWSTGTSGRARRLLPFQNAIGIRKIFDQFENGLNHAIGAEDKKDGRGSSQSERAPT